MKIAKLWANVVYNGNLPFEKIPEKYAKDATAILEEMATSEEVSAKKAYLTKKISELQKACTSTIYNGVDITFSGGETEHFTLDEHDQLNLSGIALKLISGAETIAWHENDESVSCRWYTAMDGWTIINTLTAFKEYHITYFRDLRIYVNSLETVEEINAIQYGYKIPDNYKSDVLKVYEQQLGITT